MKKIRVFFTIWLLIGCLLFTSGYAQNKEKLAQTSFQFLSVVSDARAAGMAEAMTSLQIGSSALFFNPAGMAGMPTFLDVTASSNQWIADITHSTFSLAIRPAHGNYGVLGFSAQNVNYGEFYGTRVNQASDLGYEDTGIFKLGAIALGIGYAKQLTDLFCVGGRVQWVQQDLGTSVIPVVTESDTTPGEVSNKLTPFVFDFGTQFKTGFKSLVFGMSVRNFSKEIKYVEESFQVPLVFNLGISMNVLDFFASVPLDQSLFVCFDASHYRDHPEQYKIGLDYRLMKVLSLRGGYIANNDLGGYSFGIGVTHYGVTVDYAYTPFGVFDKVQRMTARFSL